MEHKHTQIKLEIFKQNEHLYFCLAIKIVNLSVTFIYIRIVRIKKKTFAFSMRVSIHCTVIWFGL